MRFAGQYGAFQRFTVHVAEHQHLTAGGIGGHASDQPIAIKPGRQIVTFFDLLD